MFQPMFDDTEAFGTFEAAVSPNGGRWSNQRRLVSEKFRDTSTIKNLEESGDSCDVSFFFKGLKIEGQWTNGIEWVGFHRKIS